MSNGIARALLLLFCFACVSAPGSVRSPADAARATTPSEWIAAARHALDVTRPDDAIRAEMLAALEGATVVGIGEASHGTHEDVLLKSQLVLELFDAGRRRRNLLKAHEPCDLFDQVALNRQIKTM